MPHLSFCLLFISPKTFYCSYNLHLAVSFTGHHSDHFSQIGSITTGKPASHERKSALTPTQRDSIPAKSPVSGADPLGSHSPFDPHHRPVVPGEVYRTHLPPHLDHSLAFHRVLDPGNLRHNGIFPGARVMKTN